MTLSRADLKQQAKNSMKQCGSKAYLITLIYIAVLGVMSGLLSTVMGLFDWPKIILILLGLGGSCVYLVITAGYYFWALSAARGNSDTGEFGTALKQAVPVIIAGLISTVLISIGSALLIVPGVILGLGLSMVQFCLRDNTSDKSGISSVKDSWNIMKGYKMDFFLLALSFIPWLLLEGITCGIAGIYVTPYMTITFARFYDGIRYNTGDAQQNIPPVSPQMPQGGQNVQQTVQPGAYPQMNQQNTYNPNAQQNAFNQNIQQRPVNPGVQPNTAGQNMQQRAYNPNAQQGIPGQNVQQRPVNPNMPQGVQQRPVNPNVQPGPVNSNMQQRPVNPNAQQGSPVTYPQFNTTAQTVQRTQGNTAVQPDQFRQTVQPGQVQPNTQQPGQPVQNAAYRPNGTAAPQNAAYRPAGTNIPQGSNIPNPAPQGQNVSSGTAGQAGQNVQQRPVGQNAASNTAGQNVQSGQNVQQGVPVFNIDLNSNTAKIVPDTPAEQ